MDKTDIKVRFYEENEIGDVVWEGWGDFQPSNVHFQYGISFKSPKYRKQHLEQPVKVFIQLLRPSDNAVSNRLDFIYITNWSIIAPSDKRKYAELSRDSHDVDVHQRSKKPRTTSNSASNDAPIPSTSKNNHASLPAYTIETSTTAQCTTAVNTNTCQPNSESVSPNTSTQQIIDDSQDESIMSLEEFLTKDEMDEIIGEMDDAMAFVASDFNLSPSH